MDGHKWPEWQLQEEGHTMADLVDLPSVSQSDMIKEVIWVHATISYMSN